LNATGWLGLTLDAAGNAANGPRISADGPARAWVIPTNEELMIARHAQAFLH
jgi:acetate kinase